jgi:hypothetical protein
LYGGLVNVLNLLEAISPVCVVFQSTLKPNLLLFHDNKSPFPGYLVNKIFTVAFLCLNGAVSIKFVNHGGKQHGNGRTHTHLEIGVQSIYEDVARDTIRGHAVKVVCGSSHLGRDSGFKIISQMMPYLSNVGSESDIGQFIVRRLSNFCVHIFIYYNVIF